MFKVPMKFQFAQRTFVTNNKINCRDRNLRMSKDGNFCEWCKSRNKKECFLYEISHLESHKKYILRNKRIAMISNCNSPLTPTKSLSTKTKIFSYTQRSNAVDFFSSLKNKMFEFDLIFFLWNVMQIPSSFSFSSLYWKNNSYTLFFYRFAIELYRKVETKNKASKAFHFNIPLEWDEKLKNRVNFPLLSHFETKSVSYSHGTVVF